jgi:hypothetical protein
MRFLRIIFLFETCNIPKNQNQFELPYLYWPYLTRRTDFDSGLLLTKLGHIDFFFFILILTTDFDVWYGAHGWCDRSAGNVYYSMAPDPTSDIFRGPCTPILWFVFPIRLMRLNTNRWFCHFIPKLHKNSYKQIYTAGSSKYSTKSLSILRTKLLTVIKESLQRH